MRAYNYHPKLILFSFEVERANAETFFLSFFGRDEMETEMYNM